MEKFAPGLQAGQRQLAGVSQSYRSLALAPGDSYNGAMLKQIVHWLIFIAVVLHLFSQP